MNNQTKNREEWLTEVAKQLEPIFLSRAYLIKQKYRLTCSWPCRFATSLRNRRVGECHAPTMSKDGTSEIYISPTLADSVKVAGTVCHELIHVVVGVAEGHRGKFRTACRYIGMSGNPKSAMPGANLNKAIRGIVDTIGEYPHSAVIVPSRAIVIPSKSVRLSCECGCVVRISEECLKSAGVPVCGCGATFTFSVKE